MTKKLAKLLVLTLCVMLSLTGCKLVSVDQTMDDNEVVAEYKGGTIIKADAVKEYDDIVSVYEASGYAEALKDAETVKTLKTEVLDYMVKERIFEEKAKEFGVDTISEERRVELIKAATDEFNSYVDMYTPYFQEEDQTEEEARAATVLYLEQNGYGEKAMQNYALSDEKQQMLFDYVTKDVELTEDDLKKTYDEAVASDKETYEADPGAYDGAEGIAWIPEGYRTVKHILLKADEELSSELDDLEYHLSLVEDEIELRAEPEQDESDGDDGVEDDAPIEALEEEPEVQGATLDNSGDEPSETEEPAEQDESEPTEEELLAEAPKSADELLDADELEAESDDQAADADDALDASAEPVTIEPVDEGEEEEEDLSTLTDEQLQARKAELERQIADLKAKIEQALQPKADEVQAKIDAGEDFDALIEEYGEDPGMQSEPTKTVGYYVSNDSTNWDVDFQQAAMALEKVGDVSGPVYSQFGVHFIRYESDVTPGAVPFDEIKETLRDGALEVLKNETYDTVTQGWIDDAEIKLYPDKL